jgi:hypothetical protein
MALKKRAMLQILYLCINLVMDRNHFLLFTLVAKLSFAPVKWPLSQMMLPH